MWLDQIPCVAETTEWWCVMSWVRREQLPEGRVCFWKNGGTHGLWASFPHMLGPRGAWNPCVASVLACTQPWCLSHRVLMLLTERRNTSFPCHPQEWDVPFHIVISSKSFKDQNLKKKSAILSVYVYRAGLQMSSATLYVLFFAHTHGASCCAFWLLCLCSGCCSVWFWLLCKCFFCADASLYLSFTRSSSDLLLLIFFNWLKMSPEWKPKGHSCKESVWMCGLQEFYPIFLETMLQK